MTFAKFLYPLGNYFFDFDLLEVIKKTTPASVSLQFRYSLKNNYAIQFVIPIHISHVAYLDCEKERNFESDKSRQIYSDCVVNLQNDQGMYGYGDDHHVSFGPNEKKEFLVLFKPSEHDFETFDLEFFMKPDDEAYGLYRLRYDFRSKQITKRYCVKTYEVSDSPTQPTTLVNRQQFAQLFENALEIAAVQTENRLKRPVPHRFEIELHGAGRSGAIISPDEALDILFLSEDRFYRIIDIAVVAIWPNKTKIFLRVSSHNPGRFEDTWNKPSGVGPFKQMIVDQIRIYNAP